MGSGKEKIEDALFDALEKAWPLMYEKLADGSIRSIEIRVQAVIAADG